jgi:hypothetical protein
MYSFLDAVVRPGKIWREGYFGAPLCKIGAPLCKNGDHADIFPVYLDGIPFIMNR